jgi:L,D-transpeptidase YcbB
MNTGRLVSKWFLLSAVAIILYASCKHKKTTDTIAQTPQELEKKSSDLIKEWLDNTSNDGVLADSIKLVNAAVVKSFYEKSDYTPLWSDKKLWLPAADSLYRLIDNAKTFGLFPEDYFYEQLSAIRSVFDKDSLGKSERKNAATWSRGDIMLTDAFISIVKDIRIGRLPADSISLRKDSVLSDAFYWDQFQTARTPGSFDSVISALEPKQTGYRLLKAGIKRFLASADYTSYTVVPLPSKNDPSFKRLLQKRLFEAGFINNDSTVADSAHLAEAIRKFQKDANLQVDGRAGEATIRVMNVSDRERFIRIAISMDKFKRLPENMPAKYIWVNLPAYNLRVFEGDSVKLFSKVICGKPKTRTPVLTAGISELITYPQWVPPLSIILKEILPGVKRDPGYIAKKGFSLVDSKGEEVDPYSVDWSKYSKGIPYRVVQGSGDANALGIMKFSFPNKYSVYLHDTNQRYLFGQTTRSLSHGCVRVQQWHELATYLIENDKYSATSRGAAPIIDSMDTWLKNKKKSSIAVKNRFPLFIRYFTCEGTDKGIVFYDDIYGEDRMLREKYFAKK